MESTFDFKQDKIIISSISTLNIKVFEEVHLSGLNSWKEIFCSNSLFSSPSPTYSYLSELKSPGVRCASLRVPSTASRGAAAAAEGSRGPSSVRWLGGRQGPALPASQSHAVGAGTWSPQAPHSRDQRSSHRQPPPASLGHACSSAASGDWTRLTPP